MTITKKDVYERQRTAMVGSQLVGRGIKNKAVLDAMRIVPRHLFVDEAFAGQAYGDSPLPIGEGQTISQPYMVAAMIEALGLTGSERVLEIGGGSGYQTAVLAIVAWKVYSVERINRMAVKARRILDGLHASNVVIRIGDGTLGLPAEAPFDAIIVSAASPEVPEALTRQLAEGGALVMPVGGENKQSLVRITKSGASLRRETLAGCRFVKLVGKHGWQ
ncbi:MAG: protein-L-isoaspartate(D-aspartate) O-methyltransferase [Deltaproteobacteria bacterium]|nr:protein-L-isoaspartate(D-aspartate) O-methyltransferase [Deltaproteobacteria bacterium]